VRMVRLAKTLKHIEGLRQQQRLRRKPAAEGKEEGEVWRRISELTARKVIIETSLA